MEQLEFFPDQDYEDALTWLIEGIRGLGYEPDIQTMAIDAYKRHIPYASNFTRSYYFQEAFYILEYRNS